jgi:hypothetical protein
MVKVGAVSLVDPDKIGPISADFAENIAGGIEEVNRLIFVLTTALDVLRDAPADEDEDSEEYGNRAVDAIVVRR